MHSLLKVRLKQTPADLNCSSAKNFTFYQAKALNEPDTNILNTHQPGTINLKPKYADDINQIASRTRDIMKTIDEYPEKLKKWDLNINKDKTEQYEISNSSSSQWKKCKLLGTLLDTTEDIKRRKALAIAAAKNLKHLFNNNKIWIKTKARAFDTYISSVFLYNSSTWTLTKTQENQIDSFHRKMIRVNVLNVKWPKKVSNEMVYETTKLKPWSEKIKKQRLTWFGHLARMDEKTPVKIALKYATANYPKKKADQNKPG